MRTICDTHIPILFQDDPDRLSPRARRTFQRGIEEGELALADISLWEMAMLFARGRLNPEASVTPADYIRDLIQGYRMEVLPISVPIAVLSQSDIFAHKDPADRLIAATALAYRAPLVTVDEKLREVRGLEVIW
jgi:PIN domain nuclease of toxin-antitoxin system